MFINHCVFTISWISPPPPTPHHTLPPLSPELSTSWKTRDVYLCAEENGHERNNNGGRNKEHDEPSHPVLPVLQPHHAHILLEREKNHTLQGLSAQSELVWFNYLLLKPEQSGMKGPMCALGRGGSWMWWGLSCKEINKPDSGASLVETDLRLKLFFFCYAGSFIYWTLAIREWLLWP